ncbi:MAG: hypothetical protein ACT4OS_11540 [Acidimicrobiales bacterium]
MVVLAMIACVAGLPMAAWGQAGPDSPADSRVLILSLPRITWADLADESPPTLAAQLRRSSIALLSTRAGRRPSTLADSYATLGAGNRAITSTSWTEGQGASHAIEEADSIGPAGAVVHPQMEAIGRLNRSALFGAQVGALGAALASAGVGAAVVANADTIGSAVPGPGTVGGGTVDGGTVDGGTVDSPPGRLRSETRGGGVTHSEVDLGIPERQSGRAAVLALADPAGRVQGSVGPGLTRADPDAPGGLSTDLGATAAAIDRAWLAARVVLVEAGDLERADQVDPRQRDEAKALALDRADRLVAQALATVDPERDLVIIVSPAPPRRAFQLTFVAVAGPGWTPGWASSGSTRRDGYVALTDLGPTVLEHLGVSIPPAMTGGPVAPVAGDSSPSGWRALETANQRALFRDRVANPLTVTFISLEVVGYLLAAAAITSGRRRLNRAARGLALVALAVPPVSFLAGLVPVEPLGPVGFIAAFLAAACGLAGLAWAATDRRPGASTGAAALVVLGFSLALLIVDVLTGSRLQISTVFGYSPVVAGRFAGWGNLTASVVIATATLVACGLWASRRPSPARSPGEPPASGTEAGVERTTPASPTFDTTVRSTAEESPRLGSNRWRPMAAASLLIVTVILIGHPALGSDVGGVLTAVPAFGIAAVILSGRRPTPRVIVGLALAAVAALAVFAGVDLARPPASRTHLGRLVESISSGGADALWLVLRRKLSANLSILTNSIWPWLVPAALAFLVFLNRSPGSLLARATEAEPGRRAALAALGVAGLVGFALNDSGVALPAMMLAVVLPYLSYLVLVASPDAPPEPRAP